MKTYTQAPLPFIGQKRRFLNDFKNVLNQCIPDNGDDWTIIDVFGGSGLLAHTAKRQKPAARVIYNDFDGYAQRLRHIDDINRLRQILFDLTQHLPRNRVIPTTERAQIQAALQQFDGYIDVQTLASWLLFSGGQAKDLADLCNQSWYSRVRLSDFIGADNYLNELEITSQSYADLLPLFANQKKVLLILDPPYVSTTQDAYNNKNYFGMIQFLKLMSMVKPPFIFFSSTRSEFVDYLDLVIANKLDNWQYFVNYQKISVQVSMNKVAKYEDNLVYRF